MFYDKIKNGFPITIVLGWETVSITKNKDSDADPYKYSYSVNHCTINKDMFEMGEWADEQLKGDWVIGCNMSGFMVKEDAILFKMTWSCSGRLFYN